MKEENRRPIVEILNDFEFWRDVQRLRATPMEVLLLYWGYRPDEAVVKVVAYYETHLRATEKRVAILDRMTDDQADTINFQRDEINMLLRRHIAGEPAISWGSDDSPERLYTPGDTK